MGLSRKSKISIALTAVGCIGVGVTAFLAAKNSPNYIKAKRLKCADKWEELPEEEFKEIENEPYESILTKKDHAVLLLKHFWPTIISGTVTCGCIIGSQVLSLKEIAAITSLAAVLGTKYNDLRLYLQEHYPDHLALAEETLNIREIQGQKEKIEGTYDGRYRMYEPITRQVFFSNIPPEQMALECTAFVDGGLLNDNIVSVFDYVDNIKNISGDKSLKTLPWMHKAGWCLDDDVFDYVASFCKDGLSVRFEAEPYDLKLDDECMFVYSLTAYNGGNDFSKEICEAYDIE